MKKRIFCTLLAFLMLLTLTPWGALAATIVDESSVFHDVYSTVEEAAKQPCVRHTVRFWDSNTIHFTLPGASVHEWATLYNEVEVYHGERLGGLPNPPQAEWKKSGTASGWLRYEWWRGFPRSPDARFEMPAFFLGWHRLGTSAHELPIYSFSTPIIGDVDVVSVWGVGGSTPVILSARLFLNDGSDALFDEVWLSGTGLWLREPTPAPTRDGYTFRGWYTTPNPGADDVPYVFRQEVNNYLDLFARWERMSESLPFIDIAGHWATDSIRFVYEKGIMRGTGETTFSPNETFSREMMTAALFRLHHDRVANESDPRAHPFTDVTGWATPYIAWAFENGLVKGTTETTFAPTIPISRQDSAVLLHRYFAFLGLDTFAPPGQFNRFPDAHLVGYRAEEAVNWAVHHGLLRGIEGYLEPLGTADRAQAATLIERLVHLIEKLRLSAGFELTISVEETTLPQGERFRVDIEFKNNSGECHEIVYDVLLWPNPGLLYFEGIHMDWPQLRPGFIETDSVIRATWTLGSALEPGTRELRFRAAFWLNWGQENQRQIVVWSNPIVLTVTEPQNNDFVLTISVEETTLPQGERFRVDVELKNNSGKCHEIAYGHLFRSHIPEFHPKFPSLRPPLPTVQLFENGSTILRSFYLNPDVELSQGVHQLTVEAIFFLGWEPPVYLENESISWNITDSAQQITVLSNPIVLIVTEPQNNDFVLTISVEETTLPQGENFRVNVELKNNSGECHKIFYYFLFWPHIPGWNLLEEDCSIPTSPTAPRQRYFEAGSVIQDLDIWGSKWDDGWLIGSTLTPGTHELQFSAWFQTPEIGQISIRSNTVTLTVTEPQNNDFVLT